MEGAYNKVLDARPKLPDPSYGYFMEKLLSTVRYTTALTAMWLSLHAFGAPNEVSKASTWRGIVIGVVLYSDVLALLCTL